LHELGRVFRYQGKYQESERSLQEALQIYEKFTSKDLAAKQRVADTLHELGVLEVKRHNLDSATSFLQRSLEMRRGMGDPDISDANSAATLHQLAAIFVARKPPSLEKAKSLLQEALGLSRQIGQRAATLKQLARVTIRQGSLDRAESYLAQALDLYKELYGDNKNHINVAAVKFQQGALALQKEQWEQAWMHFSECLRIRKSVYAYARPVGTDGEEDPTHLEVSCVLHELARVAVAQGYYSRAMETLKSERVILERLEETADHRTERIYQARLTNLTWFRKCAKAMGDEDLATQFSIERSSLKRLNNVTMSTHEHEVHEQNQQPVSLVDESIRCRLVARKFALEKDRNGSKLENLNFCLSELSKEINKSEPGPMKAAVEEFRDVILKWKDRPIDARRAPILRACDGLR
jgi:tetratricopeptide (TPR) repeat protein